MKKKNVFQFKIMLKGIEPFIWRRIQIAESCTFWDLHAAIQDAVGWKEKHSYFFTVKDTGTKREVFIGSSDIQEDDDILPGWQFKVQDYLKFSANEVMLYLYDFSDNWEHFIEFEGSFPKQEGVDYPVCLGGERACPPENIGGIIGYERYLQILFNPRHTFYTETLQSLGDFEPEYFDVSKVVFVHFKEKMHAAFS
mgnify:FL=1